LFEIYHRAGEYNLVVARGWESKSVEEQQSEAADKSATSRPRMSPEQAAQSREIENLKLSRQRVLAQLATNPAPGHQRVLQTALADLDERLKRLEPK
jgi:hypothetical protein